MINKYCYKCGTEMYGQKPCQSCGTHAFEMPKSKAQLQTVESIKALQEKNKPKRGNGCLVMIAAGLVMFGIPAVFSFLGPGIISYGVVCGVLLIINLKLFSYRKNMTFKKKDRYFNMAFKTKADLADFERICSGCRQLITPEMTYCPKCGRQAGEDIPIMLSLRNGTSDSTSLEVN